MRTALQSVFLLLSFALVLIWQYTPLSRYTLETMAVLTVLFIGLSLLSSRIKEGISGIRVEVDKPWSVFILNSGLLLLILATGNFSSPLFFLMYFLSFGIAFAFELPTVIVFVIGIIALFLPIALHADTLRNILMLTALVALSPFAYFFGRNENSTK